MSGTPIFDPETGEILEAGGDLPPAPRAMSLDDARALLVREHGVAVKTDDPLLMLVSLHQGFLGDYEAMLRRHDQAIHGFLGATGEACAQAVEAVLASLKDKTVKASLDQAFALIERQAVAMEDFRRALRRHRILSAALSAASVVGASVAVAVLVLLVR